MGPSYLMLTELRARIAVNLSGLSGFAPPRPELHYKEKSTTDEDHTET